MPLSTGCNHVTVVSGDLDRLIAFYTGVFDAEVKLDLDEGELRHALIDLGGGFCLHAFAFAQANENARALPDWFGRGHLDHFAIDFADRDAFELVRRRLVDDGASPGTVRDFGLVKVMVFEDPDGMQCELAHWVDGRPLSLAESRVEEFVPQPA